MQIQPSGTFPPVNSTSTRTADNASTATASTKVGGTESAGYSPTSGLSDLLAQIQLAPDVRQEVVKQALQQLASGELNSPAAALDTARAFVAAQARGE